MKRIPKCIFACLGFAFFLAGASLVSSQEVAGIARKLQWCEAHKDNFDIVFVGSSRVFHGISPRIFDQVASASGQRWRSFNLGMDKMGMAQSMTVTRDLVATGPRNLRYVFFELEPGTGMLAGGQNHAVQRPQSAQPSGSGLGPDGDGFFPMARSMSTVVEPFYRERLAAVVASPMPRQPNERVRAELGRFSTRRWRRKTSRSFSSLRRRFALPTARESTLLLEAHFSPSTIWNAMHRSTPNRTGWMPSILMPGVQRFSPASSPQELVEKAESTAR